MKDTHRRFSGLTVSLHWIIALGMITLIAFGLYIEGLPRGPEKGQLIGLHKSFGIVIFVLALLRIGWRFVNRFPRPLSTLPTWQENLAKLAHWVLILGTILMPVSGVIMSVGGGHPVGVFGFELIARSDVENETMNQIGHAMHGLGGKLLILFIVLHVVGALKHQLIDKDGTMQRIFGKTVGAG